MKEIDPAHVLVAIVSVAGLTFAAAVALVCTGHHEDMSTLLTFAGSILAPLFGYKTYLIHKATMRGQHNVQRQVDHVSGQVHAMERNLDIPLRREDEGREEDREDDREEEPLPS